MHDIGKLLMGRYVEPESLDEIRQIMSEENISFSEAEHRTLGTDHTAVGGAMVEYWKFPPQLIHAIENHHDPEHALDALVDVVYLANILAKRIGAGTEVQFQDIEVNEIIPKRLGVSSSDLDTICEKVSVELEETEKLYLGTADATK